MASDKSKQNEPNIIVQEAEPGENEAGSLAASSQGQLVKLDPTQIPEILVEAGPPAMFAYEEFIYGEIANEHTRKAYGHAVRKFLDWVDRTHAVGLKQISPKMVREYLDEHPGAVATKKQHLAGLRHFFDICVTRHAMILNPALSVRGEKLSVVEGKTPEIGIKDARKLLKAIDAEELIGKRDRAFICIMIYTAARIGAVSKLKISDFYNVGGQWMLHFDEKGGKSREIPVRHDLGKIITDYIDAAGIELENEKKNAPLFRSMLRKEKCFSGNGMKQNDACRMIKRRVKSAGLSSKITGHSFRVTTITDLLEQDVALEDVQRLVGHADPRTTRLYDRRRKKVTRNIVERISV